MYGEKCAGVRYLGLARNSTEPLNLFSALKALAAPTLYLHHTFILL